MKYCWICFVCISIWSCKKNATTPNPADYYFPPLTGTTWETTDAYKLGWDTALLTAAFDFAATKKSYGIIVLHKGRIVKEKYWNGWNLDTKYPFNSAGKSVVATLAGIAQQDGILDITKPISTYLGTGWTNLPAAKENLIQVKHQLMMNTGLDDNVPDDNCMTPSCLIYKADAGTRWAYHNAPYRLLQEVLAKASGKTFNQYCREKLLNKIGFNSTSGWLNYILYGTTRDAARFGLLIAAKGQWDGTAILNDPSYFTAMTTTSQDLNKSYGYLWWLNGKASFMVPTLQTVFPGYMAPAAPADMLMALGKDDKKIYVVPSLDLVVVRLGDDAGAAVVGPSSFDNDFWAKLKPAIKY